METLSDVLLVSAVALIACCAGGVRAQSQQDSAQSSAVTNQDGIVHIPAHDMPLSVYMSEEAKAAYEGMSQSGGTSAAGGNPLLEIAHTYSVTLEERRIAGIRSDVVVPKAGVTKQNQNRVLINLHGGGFRCRPALQLLESIPIAATTKIKVISIDYHCGPDSRFPAASEDVALVYRELLKQYKPENIGIYGCSAGGILTTESIAWFQKEKLPRPGAIGVFCAADAIEGGDSRYMAALVGSTIPPPEPNPPRAEAYFSEVDAQDPLVSPTLHVDVLRQFPPTLLITGSRDFLSSSVIYAHTQLVKAGIDAELHVWEGMGHGFFWNVELPESKEMYAVTAQFFNAHLGRSHQLLNAS